ncbi:phosphoribosylamine--glycine ligase [Clostridium faecium]|uniref:Phosphoribosylamine--glycine ligase n=1 Tax=Clostridium faecium TaxID=2762223 RepID=A0ABR8YNE6_9CLOT|nr:phosphoribosylamine--glycine ligase [Clostridium faecium]MBD8045766.1 phosphoribosylamine--glycine ligase [Clostridium faecium]
MKILLIGNGGREHALAWKMSQSSLVEKIYCAPGNGGTAFENKCENVNLKNTNEYLAFAYENKIDLTVVGPEIPLCEGIVDIFKAYDLKIFGPSKKAAKLEGSKSFSKAFMKKYGVKTAEYESFNDPSAALKYIEHCSFPAVIKADGLAAGKGVVITNDREEAKNTIKKFMEEDIFSGAGKSIIIEEFLEGVEASILSITDGETIIPFISSKDHKAIYDGNNGPNTGGMGTLAPNPHCSKKVLEEFYEDIMFPTLKGIKQENMDYVGIIFFGLMITKKGVYLLEYNVRMGDPETQVVLPLMESDLVHLMMEALDKNLNRNEVIFKKAHACCVIASSKGYPLEYKSGFEITGLDNIENKAFLAGAVRKNNKFLTSGGRVLGITALGETIEEAREKAYTDIKNVNFDGIYYRRDIGKL